MFCFPNKGSKVNLNNMKFEKENSLEYYHMTCIGKTVKHTN